MPTSDDTATNARMVELMLDLARADGFSQTELNGVQIVKNSEPRTRCPVVYTPSIVIVAQGRKRGYLGGTVHTYDPDNYLVISVLLPFECEIVQASPETPLLALSVGVDTTVLGELLVEMGQSAQVPEPCSGACSSRLTPELRQAALRLLECLHSPLDCRILGKTLVREIVYRVLCGDQGAALRALAGRQGVFSQIARALRRIHSEYHQTLDVDTLAREANMSVSVFHQHFKAVTSTSPIQYLKSIRLHKARMLMAQDGVNASTAAGQVGYVSPSQFSREFKRYFGNSPLAEAARVRDMGFSR